MAKRSDEISIRPEGGPPTAPLLAAAASPVGAAPFVGAAPSPRIPGGDDSAASQEDKGRGQRIVATALAIVATLQNGAVWAAAPLPPGTLPVPSASWVASGAATRSLSGANLTVTQQSQRAVLDWDSFNVSADAKVRFDQPNATAAALNRIHDANPSVIQGQLTANGEVYLINANGILFDRGSSVNVGGLVASSLGISQSLFEAGIASQPGLEAPELAGDAASGPVQVAAGAQITAAPGGRLLLAGPRVENAGSLSAPDGQVVLAAGEKTYLIPSQDGALRGFLVEVGEGGSAVNTGTLSARRGNVTMVGRDVQQNGVATATTAVNRNGSVRLMAQDNPTLDGNGQPIAGRTGTLTLGVGSRTEVLPDAEDAGRIDSSVAFTPSRVDLGGKTVRIDGAVKVPGGEVTVTASNPDGDAAQSRIYLGSTARIDAAGTPEVVLPMSRNTLEVELRGDELKDFPTQRNGILRGQKIVVDVNRGTTVADISGYLGAITRDVRELTTAGGRVNLSSGGDVVMQAGSVVDVSGGQIRYEAGFLNTTLLLANGRLYDIADADPNIRYQAIIGDYTRLDPKWGVERTWRSPFATWAPGYVQAASAGRVSIAAPAARLQGDILGRAGAGPYQREVGRIPLGGQLDIALSGGAQAMDVRFVGAPTAPDMAFDDAILSGGELELPVGWLADYGLSGLDVKAEGRITLPAGLALRPRPGSAVVDGVSTTSSVRLTALDVDIAGDILVPGGAIALVSQGAGANPAQGVRVAGGARLDTSGQWINERPEAGGPGTRPLLINGGSITLRSEADILLGTLDAGVLTPAVLNLDGGAWQKADGKLVAGNGGSLSVVTRTASVDQPLGKVVLGAAISGHAPGKGGSLTLEAGQVLVRDGVADRSGSAPLLAADDLATDQELVVPDWLFSEFGFGAYSVTDNRLGLRVQSGADVVVEVPFLELGAAALRAPSGTDMHAVASLSRDPLRRRAGAITLAHQRTDQAAPGTDLVFEAGARIATDATGSVSLRSTTSLFAAGAIDAPAGSIELKLAAAGQNLGFGYLPEQALWLADTARLSTAGALRSTPAPAGLRRGDVLDGGSVRLIAERGFVVQQAGSVVDVSGAAAVLDLPTGPLGSPQAATVASAAGSVRIEAAEGALLDGELRAMPGGANAGGGRFDLDLTLANRSEIVPFPTPAQRVVELAAGVGSFVPAGLAYGDAVQRSAPDDLTGIAWLDPAQLTAGGFDFITVGADQAIRLGSDLRLGATAGVELTAPVLDLAGYRLDVAAAYVGLGSGKDSRQFAYSYRPAATPGAGVLQASADTLDLRANLALRNASTAVLDARGDLRLRGEGHTDNTLAGQFEVAGDLTLRAAQVYPTTLSRFRLSAPGGTIRVTGGGAATAPMSVGGALEMNAANIEVAGTLRVPLGDIKLAADQRVSVASGGVLSTSANGLTLPFGKTQSGETWVYELRPGFTRVIDTPPQQRIALDADDVQLAPGSLVDLSGGGDLLAFEFVPGQGGSVDRLAAAEADGAFAILPGRGASIAPYDPVYDRDAGIATGQTVFLDGLAGLDPATPYAVLPARYALLPGTLLVRPVDGYTDVPAGSSRLSDGAQVVAGRYGVFGTDIRDSRSQGFAVYPGYVAGDAGSIPVGADYRLSFASTFFTDPLARLPQDAGRLVLRAGSALTLAGRLDTSHPAAGRGAQVDVAGDHMAVVGAGATAAPGSVVLTVAELNALGAESLLLGGERHAAADAIEIEQVAQTVTVDTAGETLRAPELLFAATDAVTVKAGSEVDADSGAPTAEPLRVGFAPQDRNDDGRIDLADGGRDLNDDGQIDAADAVDGRGALLRLSAGELAAVSRENVIDDARGSLRVEAGATLRAGVVGGDGIRRGGSLIAEATRDNVFAGTVQIGDGGGLALGAGAIGLGAAPVDYAGMRLDAAQLASLSGLSQLRLRSFGAIDLYGSVALGAASVRRLELDAGALRGHGSVGDVARLQATELALVNRGGTAVGAGSGSGALLVDAQRLELGIGDKAITGFADTTLAAAEAVLLADKGRLDVAGNLAVVAPQIVGRSLADQVVDVAGSADFAPGSGSVAAVPGGLAARLDVRADALRVATALRLPSGRVDLLARSGDLTLASGGVIDVAGRQVAFTDATLASPGGQVNLTASAADIRLEAGSVVDFSAPAGGEAGRLALSAPNGAAWLQGGLVGAGGALQVDARQLRVRDGVTSHDLTGLASLLGASGVNGAVDLRLRDGDATLAAGTTLRAQRIGLATDNGAMTIAGTLDASGAQPGRVRLHAAGALTVDSSGRILAAASGGDGGDGRIELGSATALDIVTGSQLDAGGSGELRLRAPRTADNAEVMATLAPAGIVRAGEITLEAFSTYAATSLTSAYVASLKTETDAFAVHMGAIATRLGLVGDARFLLQPGLEIRSTGDLTLVNDWNLSSWRFDGAPAVVSLRAAGNLTLNATLSDGFDGVLPTSALRSDRSASLRLVGGADLAAADPLAVLGGGAERTDGDVALAVNKLVRTGTGDIELAAARHFDLGAGATGVNRRTAALYTAGRATSTDDYPQLAGFTPPSGTGVSASYPTGGGDVRIQAGGDVLGGITHQLVTEWQQRRGRTSEAGTLLSSQNPSWWINFGNFQQNVGALGGGDVAVSAGRHVHNLSAVIPTSGRLGGLAGSAADPANLVVTGGGDLRVEAGGDIRSGVFHVGRGDASLRAGGSVVAGREVRDTNALIAPGTPLHTILAVGDGNVAVHAGGDLDLETIVNPTVIVQDSTFTGGRRSFFFTYAEGSGAALRTLAGDVTLHNNRLALTQALQPSGGRKGLNFGADDVRALEVYPGRLDVAAFEGSIHSPGDVTLFPSAAGDLRLLAGQDIDVAGYIAMSDTDPAALLSPTFAPGNTVGVSYRSTRERLERVGSAASIHALAPLHREDAQPALVEALGGDLSGELVIPKAARLRAGRDVVDLLYRGQHARTDETTTVTAGRDVVYTVGRTPDGQQIANNGTLELAGPGQLDVVAGRDVNLGNSVGVVTTGNLSNPGLASGGADVLVAAGGQPLYAGFVARLYDQVAAGDAPDADLALLDDILLAYGRQVLNDPTADRTAVLRQVRNEEGPFAQAAIIRGAFYTVLRDTGRSAVSSDAGELGNYALGFAAEQALFGSATRQGDIRLVFSQVKTQAGGGIDLLAPGGGIDVGLTTAAAESGSTKTADQLGIVAVSTGDVRAYADGDFAVNEARVFTLGGGNIVIWSSNGDIDAGRGAKTAVSAPAPVLTISPEGQVTFRFQSVSGSGIRSILVDPSLPRGNIDLIAPNGEINAGDAGIGAAGNINVAAPRVVGADNIQVGGVSTGVPVTSTAVSGSLAGAAAAGSTATKAAADAAANSAAAAAVASSGVAGLGTVVVEVIGFDG